MSMLTQIKLGLGWAGTSHVIAEKTVQAPLVQLNERRLPWREKTGPKKIISSVDDLKHSLWRRLICNFIYKLYSRYKSFREETESMGASRLATGIECVVTLPVFMEFYLDYTQNKEVLNDNSIYGCLFC